MADYRPYTQLDVWIKTRQLVKEIYLISQAFPKEEVYSLTSQIRRAAISVPSNIAEGNGRNTPRDALHFLYIAKGSLNEVETQIYLSFDLEYISEMKLNSILSTIEECKKLLNGFIQYMKSKTD